MSWQNSLLFSYLISINYESLLRRIVFFLKYGWSKELPFVSRGGSVKNIPLYVFDLSFEERKIS